jgi:hypothetical protein
MFSTDSDTPYTIENWVAMKEPFRVVAYGLPMAFPVQRFHHSDTELMNVYETSVRPRVAQVLAQYNISSYVQNLDFLGPRHEKSKAKETLVVDTTDTNTSSWAAAASAILALFPANRAMTMASIQVEIRNSKLMYCDVSKVLPDDQGLIGALSSIREQVLDIVSASFGGAWSSIAYHMRVDRRDNFKAVGKPTIIVLCRPGSQCVFERGEGRLMQLLNTVPILIHLEVLAGEVILADGEALFLDDIPRKPRNGSSISIQGRAGDAGTLGGWLTLNRPQQKQSFKCALTCYRVVKDVKESITEYTDDNGVHPTDPRGHVVVEYPAAYDANYTMKSLRESMQNNPSEHKKSEHATLSWLMANPSIGKVLLASGYAVTKENSRLDWALIETPGTFSPNRPPARSELTNLAPPPPPPFEYTLNADSKVRNFGQIRVGDWLAKRGRTSGVTSGKVNKMDREVKWESGQVTQEIEVFPNLGDFVLPGDSGSMVLNRHGELVGLLFGREAVCGDHDIGFVTPIEAIQKHVKELSGGGYLSLD